MGQWGVEKTIEGVRLLPFVDTNNTWDEPSSYDHVGIIVLLDDGGDPDKAERVFKKVKKKYIGRSYSDWRAL